MEVKEMKKTINKALVVMLAVVAAICFVFAITITAKSAKASTDTTAQFCVVKADVYQGTVATNDDTGIRFHAQLNQKAYNEIMTEAGDSTVIFGIELSVGGKSPKYIYYTASDISALQGFNKVSFSSDADNEVYEYTATITYKKAQLAQDLGIDPDGDLIERYLQAAYKSEITARAYYQVEDGTPDFEYDDEGINRSIWGVGAHTYVNSDGDDTLINEETGEFILVGKYFDSATALENVTVDEYGTITGYEFDGTEIAYLNTQLVSIKNGKIDTELVSGLKDGDILSLCVVKEDGALINLNAKFDMLAELIETEAIYDATAQKIYYETADSVVEIDATNAFYVEENTEYELVKNEYLFNKKDAIVFRTDAYHIDDLKCLNADLTVKDGDNTVLKEVAIEYDVADADYKGITMNVKNDEGNITFSFTDVVLATSVINDGAELKNTFNKADIINTEYSSNVPHVGNIAKGVYMLVDNIDAKATGFTFTNSYWNFFDGLLDGRGHTISNLDVSGTSAKPGNGLFSAISANSQIQNIAFVDVVANYGSVFQGNLVEGNGGYKDTYGPHWGYKYTELGKDSSKEGFPIYRQQLGIPESDITSLITEYLSTTFRTGNGAGGAVYTNVYVKVASETTGLMGVIARNMVNSKNLLRGYNLVIEYDPSDKDFYNDNYTESGYGVLFGGAYTLAGAEYSYSAGTQTKTWYTPTGHDANYQDYNATVGVLNYVQSCLRVNGYRTKIYVISTVGLVSSVNGQILDTNDTASETNPYKFFTQKDAANKEMGFIERYDDYANVISSAKDVYNSNSFLGNTNGFYKFWDFKLSEGTSYGYLVWKNLPTEQA